MIVCWAVGAVGHCPPLPHFLEDQLTLSQPGGSGILLAPPIFRPSYNPGMYVCSRTERTRADDLSIEDSKMGRNRELGIFKLSPVINEYRIETDFLITRELL